MNVAGDENVNGAAPAADQSAAESPPAPPPSSSEAAPAPSPTNDAGGAAPLTPYQKRKLKEAEHRRKAEERRAKREAKKAAKPAEAAAAPAAKPEPDDEERDDAARAREAALFWRLVFRVVNLIVWPFGYRVEKLEKTKAAEDADYLVPLARRYRWFDVTIRWAAIPFVLLERLAEHVKKRDPSKETTR